MSFVRAIAVQPAANTVSVEEVVDAARIWLADKDEEHRRFERFLRASGAKNRRYAFAPQEVLKLGGQAERARLFIERGRPLVEQAIARALDEAKCSANQIDIVIFTSCTSPLIPSLDAVVLPSMGFSPTVARVPIYQQGCAGGVVGLSLANRFASAGNRVLLVSLELCSLLFRLAETSPVHLLGAALFADGAAAALIEPGTGGVLIRDAQSFLLPETTHLMGYDIHDDGAHLRLDKELPLVLQHHVRGIAGGFLARNGLSPEQVPWWLIHPGGMKILDGFARLFELRPGQYRWSNEILAGTGNLSSATVLFVLSEYLASEEARAGETALMVGIGPGLTVELILFELPENQSG